MESNAPARAPERRITRRELEVVIRRAAELYAADAEADERISEEELLRIASEIGLSARHVRQALLELPDASAGYSLLDRICGPAAAAGTRVIASDPDRVHRRLDEYLTTREYLHPLRRQQRRGWYAPAEDAISKIARVISRPKRRFHLARARRVLLAVEPLERDTAHVRLEVDLADRRRATATAGIGVGGLFGALLGGALAAAVGPAAADLAGSAGGTVAAVLTFGGAMSASVTAGLAAARARFRRQRAAARLEVEGLLDRLERDDSLDPPPAPWRRRLVSRLSHRRIAGR